MDSELPGFDNPNEISFENDEGASPKKKPNKKGGGFQSMGLSFPVLKGITKRGYKIPTPIQRKAIPLVMEGRDVVAMARTGSGKTACFLIPMFEKLKVRSAKTGARALILSPTRELALQTVKFIKEIGRFMGLKTALILGGDSMEDQFGAIHGSPDVIVTTPGRFLHVCVEMDLKLNSVEYVVFDEADRLFEMGFGEQLGDIFKRLPDTRQTLLFSATLPKVLVEFAKAGLSDPVLIRLDVESKIPDELKLVFFTCRSEEKTALLLALLKNYIDSKQQTVVFAATKHHVEYLHMVLDHAGITNTYIFSSLDPSARKINAAKFSMGKVSVLVVTDLAARGIDIPQLDNVINYHFPAKSKLFVHRVGRCARAGRSGTAYSLVAPDEHAYFLDLHLFLGRPLRLVLTKSDKNEDGCIGKAPQSVVEEQQGILLHWLEVSTDLASMLKVSDNGYKQYIRSREAASMDSVRRTKETPFATVGIHPFFNQNEAENTRETLLEQMKRYRPNGTVFEIGVKNNSTDYKVMKEKRAFHKDKIVSFHRKLEQIDANDSDEYKFPSLTASSPDDINNAFHEVVLPKKRRLEDLYKRKTKKIRSVKDTEHFVPYLAPDRHTEEGLAVNSFQQEASKVQLDITADSEEVQKLSKRLMKWDRKKKKMVAQNKDPKANKILTESGVWIPATYKSNRYSQWKEKTKVGTEVDNSNDEDEPKVPNRLKDSANTHWARHNRKLKEKERKTEFKSNDQILKSRMLEEKKKRKNKQKRKGKKKK